MKRVSQALSDVRVVDLDGQPHQMAEIWSKKPTLIVFVRHFGCLFCHQQALDLKPHVADLAAHGIDLAFVGTGSPFFGVGFRDRLGLDAPIYCDEKHVSFDAAGMHRGILTLLDPRVAVKGVKAFWSGSRQGKMQGDATQQGGMLLVLPDGRVPYRFVSQYAGDHADLSTVLPELFTRVAA